MADIAIGKALRNGSVRQTAIRARNHAGTSIDCRRSSLFKSTKIDERREASAWLVMHRIRNRKRVIGERVGAFPSLRVSAICRPE